jgi:uncharacterized membrane protein
MKAWIEAFKTQLKKHFYAEEVDEIVAYYQEMIEERIEKGEKEADVLASYDIKEVIKDMLPEMIRKRDIKSYREWSKSSKQILLLMLSTPILLPLAFVYIALIITAFSILIASLAIGISSIAGILIYAIDIFGTDLSFIHQLGILGIGIVTFSFLLLLALHLSKWIAWISAKLIKVFTSLIKRGEEKHENI